MGYQPIQIGQPMMFDAMQALGNTLASNRHEAQALADAEDAKKRQKQQDFAMAFEKAQKMAQAGDLEGARAILAPHVQDMQLQQMGGPAPATPGPMPPGPPGGPQGGPPPGPPPPAPMAPAHTAADFDMEHGQAPGQLPPPPGPADRAAMLKQMAPPTEVAPPAPPPPPNPIMAASEAGAAKNAERARQVLRFRDSTGQQITMDPEGQRQAAFQQRAAKLDTAFAGIEDPEMKAMYQRIRPVLLSSSQDVDPTDVFRYIQSETTNKRASAQAEAKTAHDEAVLNQRDRLTEDRIAQSDLNNRRMTQALLARVNTQEGSAATAIAGRTDTEFNRWAQQQNWKGLSGGTRQLDAAERNIASGNALSERDAQIQLARFYRQAQPTEGEMHLLYQNLAGRLGNALPRFMENMNRGGLSPAEKDILAESIGVARQEQHAQIANVLKSAQTTFGPGSGHENLSGNINTKVKGMFAGIGVDVPDVFPAQGGQEVPTVTLGKGNKLVDATTGKKKQPAVNPMTEASRLSKVDPADRPLAAKALATKPGDPLYGSAQKWLAAHGLQQ